MYTSAATLVTGPRALNLDGGGDITTTRTIIICRLEKVHVPLVYNKTSGAVYFTARHCPVVS
jgi:hypothetical protein